MQYDRNNFAPNQQSLTISEDEARTGTSREITLPNGERTSIFIPPGTFSGRVIPVDRQGMPQTLVTVNVAQGMGQGMVPPPPPLEKTQLASRPGDSNPQWGAGPGQQEQWGQGQWNQGPAQGQWNQAPVQGANAQGQWNQVPAQGANAQGQWGQGQIPNQQGQWNQGGVPPVAAVQGQGATPAKRGRGRIFVLAGIAILIIIAAIIGIFAFTTVQHNQQVAATSTAQSQTQVAQNNAKATQSAIATATQGAVNATATAVNSFPAVAGNYTGNLTNNNNSNKQFPLALALQQNQGTLSGTCSIDNLPLQIQNGSITQSGHMTFSVTIPGSNGSSSTQVNFTGSQQSDGSLSGTWTSSTGGAGPWTATKS